MSEWHVFCLPRLIYVKFRNLLSFSHLFFNGQFVNLEHGYSSLDSNLFNSFLTRDFKQTQTGPKC